MKSFRIFFLMVWAMLCASPALSASWVDSLREGPYVLMIRHADAPGFSDPPGFKIGDCSTQRNLGERGRQQALDLGLWLKQQGIDSAQVLSSAWCRCVDTATLLAKGPVTIEPSLGSFFQNASESGPQTAALRVLLADRLKGSVPRKPLILVTHQVNISAYTGESVGQGDVMLVKVGPRGEYLSHRSISVSQPN